MAKEYCAINTDFHGVKNYNIKWCIVVWGYHWVLPDEKPFRKGAKEMESFRPKRRGSLKSEDPPLLMLEQNLVPVSPSIRDPMP